MKVDNATVDLYYRNFRAVCTAAVHDEIVNMGGNGKTVEIGVISLGTTTSDGNKREVHFYMYHPQPAMFLQTVFKMAPIQ